MRQLETRHHLGIVFLGAATFAVSLVVLYQNGGPVSNDVVAQALQPVFSTGVTPAESAASNAPTSSTSLMLTERQAGLSFVGSAVSAGK